jgi:type II secretory pathway component PulK
VLWALTGIAMLSLTLSLAANESLATVQNRVRLTRAAWRAEGCLERARSAIAAALVEADTADAVWRDIDSVVAASPLTQGCRLALRPAGLALDANSADDETLRALLLHAGLSRARVDSLVDALLDWRDDDDVPRPRGAERAWYESRRRIPPRNGRFVAIGELLQVRGFDAVSHVDSLLTVEPGRVYLTRAPLHVLAALPGFGVEVLAEIAERRTVGIPVADLLDLGARLSPAARDALIGRYAELVRLTTMSPDAWIATSEATDGSPPEATVELRLVHADRRAAIVRRRSWP